MQSMSLPYRGDRAAPKRRTERVALIGASGTAVAIAEYLRADGLAEGTALVGIFDERASRIEGEVAGLRVHSGFDELRRLVRGGAVDTIIVALYGIDRARLFDLVARLRCSTVDICLPLEAHAGGGAWGRQRSFGGAPFVVVGRSPVAGWRGIAKGCMDFGVAAFALLLTGPVLLAAALAIRLESPGPVLFRQARVGRDGRVFQMYKLRTMVYDPADRGTEGTTRADPRVTRVGAWLRKTSIDELPQMLNVLRGEMSVVGPRAHVPDMRVADKTYAETVAEYVARHRVKTGITGWAQINGMRGGIRDAEKARRGVQLDLHYIENWSPWFDIKIMYRTIVGGLAGRDVF